MSNPVIDDFARSDSPAMVAAALHILALLASDPEERHTVMGPWAWDLRQRARKFEARGRGVAASQAKVIARLIGAVAIGEISSGELSRAAAEIGAEGRDVESALALLEASMLRAPEPHADAG